ncbi:MAG: hypothetical protein CYPHOPRED_004689, partial [Cyphobasidiales sp. Tagirdzhanova-0007]
MPHVWTELPDDWGILMLGYADPQPDKQWRYPTSDLLVDRMYWGLQTHAYIVNGDLLHLIVSATGDYLHTPLDRMLLQDLPKQGLLQLYGVRPPL